MTTTNDDLNEDWLKTQSWDLGDWTSFLDYLHVLRASPARQRLAIAAFMRLPAWQAAPDDIKQKAAELR